MNNDTSMAFAISYLGLAISCWSIFVQELDKARYLTALIFGISLEIFLFLTFFFLFIVSKRKSKL